VYVGFVDGDPLACSEVLENVLVRAELGALPLYVNE
jgi:hypothetical protein